MKNKILGILVCILLVSSLTPIVESATRIADNVYNSNVESDLNTFGGSVFSADFSVNYQNSVRRTSFVSFYQKCK